MADGACGVGGGGRAYSPNESSSVDATAQERAAAAEEARRREGAEAAAKQDSFIAGARCGGSPPPSLLSVDTRMHASAATALPANEQQRVESIVRPGFASTFDGLTGEILRLKRLPVPAGDAPLRAAVTARIGELTAQWAAKAPAENYPAPTAGFDPYGASDRVLRAAFLWTEIGGGVPLQVAMTGGEARFREDIFEAVALRTPGLDTMLLASYEAEPAIERGLIERELLRLGDHSPCRPDDTLATLRDRRTSLLRAVDEKQATIDGKIRWIGLDGRQGTFEQLVDYELEQRVLAMNPGTTAGSLAAAGATMLGADTNGIRAAGAAGNAWQAAAGMVAGTGDPRTLGPKRVSQMSGRRREIPRGPGLGRRSNVHRASASTGISAGRRAPSSLADKHILNGEINARGAATGFHHEGVGSETNARIVPGTQTRPNGLGVYTARVEIKDPATGAWVLKNAESTFFPKTWTRSEVRTAILEAFANRTEEGEGRWVGTLASGMKVRGFVDDSRRIVSAYPEME